MANFVPKPEPDHGYAETKGLAKCATARALPAGLKATPLTWLGGRVAGLANVEPKPEPLHWYAKIYGEPP